MNWPEPSRVRGLPGWLIIATYELAGPARERIRLEIEAHYADAVQDHLASGSTETAAEAAALAELGDARVAAKHFRRRHLTEKEATQVEKLLRYARSNWVLLLYYAVALVLLLVSHDSQQYGYHRPILMSLILAVAAVQTVKYFVAKRNSAKPSLNLFMSLEILYRLIWLSMMTVMIGGVVFTCLMTVTFAPCIRVWFKLWKCKNAREEMPLPPRDTFSAWLR